MTPISTAARLQGALDFALRLQAAVRLGSAGRTERSWVQVRRSHALTCSPAPVCVTAAPQIVC